MRRIRTSYDAHTSSNVRRKPATLNEVRTSSKARLSTRRETQQCHQRLSKWHVLKPLRSAHGQTRMCIGDQYTGGVQPSAHAHAAMCPIIQQQLQQPARTACFVCYHMYMRAPAASCTGALSVASCVHVLLKYMPVCIESATAIHDCTTQHKGGDSQL
jgi:hypothetical protein